ncbi:hypothetical protein Cgig2_017100 [Carnegiea gigantea]|uniref:Uncharacterized protein n=1 Tax=Carnegiea gigantea TaxID=171969 RepID=A0A9Q1JMX4_9CARY|nr:hypothetical protein Cgig2_017100 [Carnegiea gigantea]
MDVFSEEEDDALIEVLKDLANGGTLFKANNGFKPGCTSGFGWDPETKSVVVEKEVRTAYVKNHPRVNDWKSKPCPYYEDLCIIFGKDRASGKDTQGPEEMEDERDEPESSSTQEPSGVEASSWKSENLGKRIRASDNLAKGLSEVAYILGREIRAASSNSSRAIDFDVELSEKRSKLNEELANLGLKTMERHRATRKIASEPESIDVFFSILNVERKEWVEALLQGDI